MAEHQVGLASSSKRADNHRHGFAPLLRQHLLSDSRRTQRCAPECNGSGIDERAFKREFLDDMDAAHF
jgi:hypothetical protein